MLRRLLFFFLVVISFQSEATAQIEVFYESRPGTTANTVEVDVKVNNLVDIVLFQFSINYDSLLLQYNSVSNFTTELAEPSNPGTPTFVASNVGVPTAMNLGVDPGEITVSWNNDSTEPDSAPDGTTLFTVIFQGLAMPCSMTNLTVTDEPRVIEVFDNAGFPNVNIGVSSSPTAVQIPGPDCGGGGGPGGDGCPMEGDANGVGITLQEVEADMNTNVCLQLTVDNWTDIQTSQFSISWDPTILSYTGTGNYGLTSISGSSFNAINAANGNVNFNYFDGANPSTLTDGTILFEICFDVIGSAGQSTDILLGDNLSVEFSDSNDNELSFFTDCGEVIIVDGGCPTANGCDPIGNPNDIGLSIGDTIVSMGDQICIPIIGTNWNDIVTGQAGFSWDPSIIMFTGIQGQNPNVPELGSAGAYNTDETSNGLLTFVYTDSDGGGSPANVDDETLFEICFTVIGDVCELTDIIIGTVTINGVSLSPEFSNVAGMVLPFYTDCGEVVITDEPNPEFTLNVASGNVAGGDVICIDVTAREWQDILTAQFTIVWDAAVLTLDRVDCVNSDIGIATNDFMFFSPDRLRFSWSGPGAMPQSIDDDDVLFCLCFEGICDNNVVSSSVVNIVDDGSFPIEIANGSNQEVDPVNINPGTITVEVCTDPVITIDANAGATCNGDLGVVTTTIDPSNSTCVWTDNDNNNAVVSMDCDASLPAGNYTLTATDDMGNTATTTVNVSEPDAIVVNVSTTNAMCDGQGSASVSTTGGVNPLSYSWSVAGCGDSATCTDIDPGTYSVTVTDSDGCSSTSSFMIAQDGVNFTVTENVTDVSCDGPGMVSLTINGSSDTSIAWNPDIGNGMSVDIGNYAYTVTDNVTMCTVANVVSVSSDVDEIACNGAVTNVLCNGDASGSISLQISGGCADESYQINYLPPNGSINGNIISGLIAASYSVTVTDDNGSTCVNTFDVTEPDALIINVDSITPSTGTDGAISTMPTGGVMPFIYTWEGPSCPDNCPDDSSISMLAPGLYDLTVTDANGCTVAEQDILVPDEGDTPTLSNVDVISEDNNNGFGVSCAGLTGNLCDGAVNATVSGVGADPVTIMITPDGGTAITADNFPITGLCAGTYTLEVTVGNVVLDTIIVITEPDPISISHDVVGASGPNDDDGEIDLTVVGGIGTYTYEWSGPSCPCDDEPDLFDLLPGEYSVFVTDENGCTGLEQNILIPSTVEPIVCYIGSPFLTPNGDNANDVLMIACAEDRDNNLEVYDRWGRLVFGAANYTGDWAGIDNDGNELGEGAYYWVLAVRFADGASELYRGTVTLLRD